MAPNLGKKGGEPQQLRFQSFLDTGLWPFNLSDKEAHSLTIWSPQNLLSCPSYNRLEERIPTAEWWLLNLFREQMTWTWRYRLRGNLENVYGSNSGPITVLNETPSRARFPSGPAHGGASKEHSPENIKVRNSQTLMCNCFLRIRETEPLLYLKRLRDMT